MFTRRVAVLSVLLLALVAANPQWATFVGLDVWNIAALHAEVEHQTEVEQTLIAHNDDIRRRIEIKEGLVADLIDGRATLVEVTTLFITLNQSQPSYMECLRATYPADTYEEVTARAVLGFVAARVTGLPAARRTEVMTRLDAEFCRYVESLTAASE